MKKKLSHLYIILCLFFFLIISVNISHANIYYQNNLKDTTHSLISRKTLIKSCLLAHSAFTIYVEYKWWWEGDYHPFRHKYEGIFNNYSLGVDKLGHFYISYLYFHSLNSLMKWGGYNESSSLWISSLLPAIYATSVEIGDGFSSYQFSFDDLGSNLLGIGYGLLQEKHPFFKNINFKWSYYPTKSFSKENNNHFTVTDDYDGHIYWMSFNVHNLLPEKINKYWPEFLNFAIGYGGENISKDALYIPKRKFAIGLDYNLSGIHLNGKLWNTFVGVFKYIHFPAPGFRIIEGEPAKFKPLLTK